MSVYHCPVCPLIFQFRTEVEWHLREEHRSRTDEAADLRAELAVATKDLDWNTLDQLRSSQANPSVTLLLSTAPASAMTVLDVARLRQLAERARRRLSAEPQRETAVNVVEDRLSWAVSAAESKATDRGMVILVNKDHLRIITLPFAPRDRHVVDRGFATRDLEYALRRFPRYRILVLGHHPRILEGHARQVCEVGPSGTTTASPTADALLTRRAEAAGDLPLVVVGDHRSLHRFRHHSPHAGEIVAEVPRLRFHQTHVAEAVQDALDRLHHQQQSRAVSELLHADMQSQIAWGVHAAWNAIHSQVADRLWVEHEYALPGRTTPGVYGIETTSDANEPGAIDDLVDALIARAGQLGIETHLLDKGALDRPEPVAVKIPIPAPTPAPSPPSLTAAASGDS